MEPLQVYVNTQVPRAGIFHGRTLLFMKPWCAAICCLALLPGRQSTFWLPLPLRIPNFNPWKPSIVIASAPSQPFNRISAMRPSTSPQTSTPSTPTSPKQFGATFGVYRTSQPSLTHLQLEYSPDGFVSFLMRQHTPFKLVSTTLLQLLRNRTSTKFPQPVYKENYKPANVFLHPKHKIYGRNY